LYDFVNPLIQKKLRSAILEKSAILENVKFENGKFENGKLKIKNSKMEKQNFYLQILIFNWK